MAFDEFSGGGGSVELAVIIKTIDQYSAGLAKTSASLKELEGKTKTSTGAVNTANKEMEEVSKKSHTGMQGVMDKTGKAIENFGGKFGKIAGGFSLGAGAMVGAIVLAGKLIVDHFKEINAALLDAENLINTQGVALGNYSTQVLAASRAQKDLNDELARSKTQADLLEAAGGGGLSGWLKKNQISGQKARTENVLRSNIFAEIEEKEGYGAALKASAKSPGQESEIDKRVKKEMLEMDRENVEIKNNIKNAEADLVAFARERVELEARLSDTLKTQPENVSLIQELQSKIEKSKFAESKFSEANKKTVDAMIPAMQNVEKLQEKAAKEAEEWAKALEKGRASAAKISQFFGKGGGAMSESLYREMADKLAKGEKVGNFMKDKSGNVVPVDKNGNPISEAQYSAPAAQASSPAPATNNSKTTVINLYGINPENLTYAQAWAKQVERDQATG